jgi:pilus assembly protein TadC
VSLAALLLAAAVLIGPGPARPRLRPVRRRGAAAAGERRADPLAEASALEVFAACLRAGMPVSTAARATVPSAPPPLAAVLTRAADLLALGADPAEAWADANACGRAAALLRLARRSARSGTALAHGVAELAEQARADAADAAHAAAERAGVLIAAPLGVCFLPAFVCLGIVPVVAGLAGDLLRTGLV